MWQKDLIYLIENMPEVDDVLNQFGQSIYQCMKAKDLDKMVEYAKNRYAYIEKRLFEKKFKDDLTHKTKKI